MRAVDICPDRQNNAKASTKQPELKNEQRLVVSDCPSPSTLPRLHSHTCARTETTSHTTAETCCWKSAFELASGGCPQHSPLCPHATRDVRQVILSSRLQIFHPPAHHVSCCAWRKRSRFTTHVFTRLQRENATWPSIALVSALWRPSHRTEHPPTATT